MQSKLNPYLHFNGNAREAMEFYQKVFGGKLNVSTFQEYGMAPDSSDANKIMHAQLETDNGITLMGSDTPSHMAYTPGASITNSLSGDNEAELRGYFERLCEGGRVDQPLEQAPWGDSFGMVTDKYGFEWMVNIAGKRA